MFEAVVLGIIQGLTEFFPVSSTAHLIITAWVFKFSGMVDTLGFDAALHAGTLVAVIFYFQRDWLDMLRTKRRLLFLIIIATVPAGTAGFFLNDIVENVLRSPLIIAGALIVVSGVMWISEKYRKTKGIDEITFFDAIFIGLAQVFALIPGVSRSGITISAGLFKNLDRRAATRFSFLLSTPVIGGAALLHMVKIFGAASEYNIKIILAGIAVSALAGFFAIRFLMNFFKRHTLNTFIYYRLILAFVILIALWLK